MISKINVFQGLDAVRDPMSGEMDVILFGESILTLTSLEMAGLGRALIEQSKKFDRQLAVAERLKGQM